MVGIPSPKATVVQYDFAKVDHNRKMLRNGSLSPDPPSDLLAAVRAYRAEHRLRRDSPSLNPISDRIGEIIYGKSVYPGVDHDLLFPAWYNHERGSSCVFCDKSKAIPRPLRQGRNIVVHYGSIGSANQLIRDAEARDRLASEYGVLCLDTESAGVMKDFPCLTIRGISHYADSHGNILWEYTEDILLFMSTRTRVREELDANQLRSAASILIDSSFQAALELGRRGRDNILRPASSNLSQNLTLELDETVGSPISSGLSEMYSSKRDK